MDAMQFEVLPANALRRSARAQVRALCSDAYGEDFSPYLELLVDAVHVLARRDGALVGHAAWVARTLYLGEARQPLDSAYVEAVAVPTALQGRGYGTQLMRALPPLLTDFDVAVLSPSQPRFYARLGWQAWRGRLWYRDGDETIPTPEEGVMIYRLPRTPRDLDLDASLGVDWRRVEVW
jgi:GNAT superfamily N-acetyltransferase